MKKTDNERAIINILKNNKVPFDYANNGLHRYTVTKSSSYYEGLKSFSLALISEAHGAGSISHITFAIGNGCIIIYMKG